jgi:hypothetical protein
MHSAVVFRDRGSPQLAALRAVFWRRASRRRSESFALLTNEDDPDGQKSLPLPIASAAPRRYPPDIAAGPDIGATGCISARPSSGGRARRPGRTRRSLAGWRRRLGGHHDQDRRGCRRRRAVTPDRLGHRLGAVRSGPAAQALGAGVRRPRPRGHPLWSSGQRRWLTPACCQARCRTPSPMAWTLARPTSPSGSAPRPGPGRRAERSSASKEMSRASWRHTRCTRS